MSVTIMANGLTICHKGSGGSAKNSTPDVCKTPTSGGPVPIPYMIVSLSSDLVRGSTTVKADGGYSIANKGSAHSRCTGDEAGTVKGVVSGTQLDESTWITYSPNVLVQGKNICRKTDKLHMNKKNCMSGVGGEYEVPLSVTDPILQELCRVFCEAREEWHRCKRSQTGGNCTRPSSLAQDKVQARLDRPNSQLNRSVSRRFAGAVGQAEKTFYGMADDIFEGARKIYTQSGLRDALARRVRRITQQRIVERGAKIAGRAWLKLVPGLNVISGIADGVGIAMDVVEITQMIRNSDVLLDNAIRIQPDFAVQGADGTLEQVYDFKFDDPETGYIDDWQRKQQQEEAYRRTSGGRDPIKVDNETCGCDRGPRSPSNAMM